MEAIVWVAIITSVCGLIGTIVTVACGNKSISKKTKELTDLTLYRIDELEKKQDVHNGFIERTYKIEGKVSALEDRMSKVEQNKVARSNNRR